MSQIIGCQSNAVECVFPISGLTFHSSVGCADNRGGSHWTVHKSYLRYFRLRQLLICSRSPYQSPPYMMEYDLIRKLSFRVLSKIFSQNVSIAEIILLAKIYNVRNPIYGENCKLKRTCAQSHNSGTHTNFQFDILTINVISGIVNFREIILESSQNVSEATPGAYLVLGHQQPLWRQRSIGARTRNVSTAHA